MEKSILINEIFPDPVGADRGYEWLEIVNISEYIIDVSLWEIQVGGIRYNRAFRFPSDSQISPGEYILVCEEYVENCDYYTSLIAMQNGIGKTDGVRILNSSGKIIDTVLYSKPNINELKNDFGDIEDEKNIITMPPEGYSIARRDYLDTNFSILDFFATNNPTPGTSNIPPEKTKIILSEISPNYIEFYTPKSPSNINEWYILTNLGKINLSNENKNNFFVLDLEDSVNEIQLHSPDNNIVDEFFKERISKNYNYCRLNSQIDEEFEPCEATKGQYNIPKTWEYKDILQILQMNIEDEYIIQACLVYEYEDNIPIISDNTMAKAVKCEKCKVGDCYTAEIGFKKEDMSKIYTIEEIPHQEIDIEKVNSDNYLKNLNKIVQIEATLLEQGDKTAYFETEIGLLQTSGDYNEDRVYLLQGIFEKQNNSSFTLQYPILLKSQSSEETAQTLENTGSPLFLLSLLMIVFLLIFSIFTKKVLLFILFNYFVKMTSR